MNRNDVKKALYKEKPIAKITDDLILITPIESLSYKTRLSNGYVVYFNIPLSDWPNSNMIKIIESQLLIRWLLDIKENE